MFHVILVKKANESSSLSYQDTRLTIQYFIRLIHSRRMSREITPTSLYHTETLTDYGDSH